MVFNVPSSEFCVLQLIIISRISLTILCGAAMFHQVLMNVERYIYIYIYIAIKNTPSSTQARSLKFVFSAHPLAVAWIAILLLTVPLVILGRRLFCWFRWQFIIFCQLETCRHERQIVVHHVSVEEGQKFLKEKKAFKLTTIVLVT